jgi:hypothetical protein
MRIRLAHAIFSQYGEGERDRLRILRKALWAVALAYVEATAFTESAA